MCKSLSMESSFQVREFGCLGLGLGLILFSCGFWLFVWFGFFKLLLKLLKWCWKEKEQSGSDLEKVHDIFLLIKQKKQDT